ncbi:membrane-spanning 4-domains subfamily A member 4D-like isoform X2 [Denticeps clupeoides]|uniref:membrane-spanning 4-domains subfamily A member 4D-like isoform X2 n=1 Tax=Denticeps clupeoides TaxID=299321 RepID=UPI0010A322AF|nr:membrane-spanning 4-domains subfamily A member 4D-like isoform X2 [Denticeps clupeoides]
MSSSVSTADGFVVVTHIYPQQPVHSTSTIGHQQHNTSYAVPGVSCALWKFLKGEPKALGTVEIMIGVIMFLFGIVIARKSEGVVLYSGIMFWGAIIYVIAGSLSVAAEKNLNRCLVKASLGMNVVSSTVAGTAIILHSVDFIIILSSRYGFSDSYYFTHPYEKYQTTALGINSVMLILAVLEFIVSIYVSAFGCRATCTSSTQPLTVHISGSMPGSMPISTIPVSGLNTSETAHPPPYSFINSKLEQDQKN